MTPIESLQDLTQRYTARAQQYNMRNKMVALCSEVYDIERERKSNYLSGDVTEWRSRVGTEYHQASPKGHNAIDIMTAVLSGHPPQFRCLMPGNIESTIPSRAEMFLDGVFRLNSRRQQMDIARQFIFNTIKDGACGMRVYWTPNPPEAYATVMQDPMDPEAPPMVVQAHNNATLPICIEVIPITCLYPGPRGAHGKPFMDIIYAQRRTVQAIVDEWGEVEGVDLNNTTKRVPKKDWHRTDIDYFEWWGEDNTGQIWYAIATKDDFIVSPTVVNYPAIPFVISSFKFQHHKEIAKERLPFLYPIFEAIEKFEYVQSRSRRLIDLYANMNPYHSGETPIEPLDATWGNLIELGPREDIKYANWPGQPPDVYREVQEIQSEISQGTFSEAMFGEVSSRVSGYAMSQIIGADTLRTDTPRGNLELAFSSIADLVFGLMQHFSPDTYMAVTTEIKHRTLAAMLAGNETRFLVVETYIKPKQTNDEVRMAAMGAQIASLPKPPVSTRYILEHYFGVAQPEEEIARRIDEEAQNDPLIRMQAMIQVLMEQGSPFAGILMQQLQQAVMQATGGQGQPAGMPGMGLGLPQATMGNPPMPGPTGNPSEEAGMTQETALQGGPREVY